MTAIQFINGIEEEIIPNIRLTRSKDGSTGTATFRFVDPQALKLTMQEQYEITGMYLVDQEGELATRDVNARFINGKPKAIEAIYVIKSPFDWDRFMRFMERYANKKGLTFVKA